MVRFVPSLLPFGLLILLAGSISGCARSSPPPPKPLPVDISTAAPFPFAQEVATISTLEAVEWVQLAAQAGGRIQELRIRQGKRVRPGQLLVVLDQAQLQAEVASLRAEQAKNRLNYERFDYLARVGAASLIQRDELRQASIASTASLKAKEADLAYRDLRSPIAGVIGDVRVRQGDVIKAGDPFTTVIRNGELMARIDVPAGYRRQLRSGLPVFIEDADHSGVLARGVVNSIDPSVKAGSQVLLVKARLDNRDGSLRNGLRVRARIVLQSSSQLAVPAVSVIQSSGQSYVFKLGTLDELQRNPGQVSPATLKDLPATGRFALQTRVSLGPLQNGRYPVLRGLNPGTAVITSNLLNLRHGLPVSVAGESR